MSKVTSLTEKPLHILVSGVTWPPETFINRLLDGLLQKGVRITVATHKKPKEERQRREGLSWLLEPAWGGNYLLRLLRLVGNLGRATLLAPKELRLFCKLARQERGLIASLQMLQRLLPYAGRRWDVVYFPWNSGAIERMALFDLGIPVVISCRGSQVNTAPYNPDRTDFVEGLRSTLKKATLVHCVTQDIQDKAVQLGLDPNKAAIIHPAVDPCFFTPSNRQPFDRDVFRIVSTGGLIWQKGYEYALLAIQLLKSEGIPIQYHIIGDGPERHRVLFAISDLELQDCVQLLGRQPATVVRDTLQQADAFLLTSLSEGIANVVLEAMACGLPVVTTDCGGMREAVTDGVDGFVTPVRDPYYIAQALEKLWRDPALRQSMGEKARQRVLDDFSLEKQVGQFLDMFSSLPHIHQ